MTARLGRFTSLMIVGIAQLVAIGGQFALIKTLTQFLTAEQFGTYAIVLAVGAWVTSLLLGPVAQAATRFYHEAWELGQLAKFYRATCLISTVAIASACVFFLIARMMPLEGWFEGAGDPSTFMLYGLLTGVGNGVAYGCVGIINASRHRPLAGVFLILIPWGQVGILILAKLLGATRLEDYLLSIVLVQSAIFGLGCFSLKVLYDGTTMRVNKDLRIQGGHYLGRMLSYAQPFVLWAIPMYIILFGDRWILARYADGATVGSYTVMIFLTMNVLTALITIFDRVWGPEMFAIAGSGDSPERLTQSQAMVNRATYVILAVCVPILGVYWVWPESIMALVSSRDYAAYSDHLWALLIAAILFALAQWQSMHGMMTKKVSAYVGIKLLVAVLAIGLLSLSGKSYGTPGIIYSLVFVHAVHFGLIYVSNVRQLRHAKRGPATAADFGADGG